MAVAFDANSTTDVLGSSIATLDLTTLTVGSGANRALVAQVSYSNGGDPTGPAINWDQLGTPQALTQIVKIVNGTLAMAQLWGLVNPISGNKTLRWTNIANVSEVILNATAVTGANQTGGVTTFPNSVTNIGTSTAPSITITSASGNMTIDAGAGPEVVSVPTQTQIYIENGGTTTSAWASRAAGAASNIHSWTLGNSVAWAECGTDIAAAGAGGDTLMAQAIF
jgi:hypothetical protein